MIESFGDQATADLFHGRATKAARSFSSVARIAARKLDMINAAHALPDLKVPPGNHLEALKGELKGFHSIRINDQFRIVFRWAAHGAHEVRVTDYH